ncbi:MAG: glycosyltransferase [Planctomycetes bacterium]|nr:glycosyltransferase [Planctomycetota bacterium]
MPRVSACFTHYNYAGYCAEAVGSILSQTLADLEVVLVENGSTDGSLEVLRRFEADPRVRLVPLARNVGPAAGWQHALERATGDYVAFLSTDDAWPPDFLARAASFLDGHPDFPMVYGRVEVFGGPPEACAAHARAFQPPPAGHLPYLDRLLEGNFVPQAATLVRRRLAVEVGGYDPAIHVNMDYDLGLRLALRGPAGYLDRVVARYRWHGGNVSAPTHEAFLRATADRVRSLRTLLAAHTERLRELGRLDRVRAEYHRALERLARAHYRRGEFAQARPLFGEVVRARPLRLSNALRYLKSCLRSRASGHGAAGAPVS